MISDNERFNMQVKPNSAFLNELKSKLPEFFDREGNFDLDKFKGQLKEYNINELSDGYQLNFIGKDYARRQAGEMPSTVIVPDEEQNNGEGKDSKNLFFTGDNLEVLRHLRNNYAGKIDVIYIDPPYNTGEDGFTYPDRFEYSDNKLQEMFGLDDEQIIRLKSIQKKSSHSSWLSFMYPRLSIAHKLLNKRGVIFISIDENELANATLLMNEIFGEKQFKVQFVWTKTETPPALSNYSRRTTEYILTYEKESFGEKYYGSELDNSDAPLINGSNSMREVVFPKNSCVFNKYENTLIEADKFNKIVLLNDIEIKNSRNVNSFKVQGKIRWTQEKINNEVSRGTIFIFKSRDLNPRFLRKDTNGNYKTPNTNLNKDLGVLTNEFGIKRLKEIEMDDIFTNPKPTSLIKYLSNIVTRINKNAVILDFFAGSSTTADAVMQLNAEDGGNRKFIMVQLPEKTYTVNSDGKEVPTKGGKAAYEAGFKSIDEISRERIRRAAAKIKSDNDLTLPKNFDGSFKHYRVVNPAKQTLEDIEDFDPDNTTLFTDMVDSFSSRGLDVAGAATGEQTILTTWLAKDGYSFDADIKKIDFDGYEATLVEDSRLYIINNGWSSENTEALLNKIGTHQITIQTIVLFGYSFNIADLRELEIGLKQLDSNINLLKRY
ncbi:site-specific DNA-methyltransferase [Ligilactobacillus salivarius]|uniref:Site-specific DNA-methyltransferase n=1 Tax=Ligilactobacillus salivarius TaxID=1624 RepID=A0A2U2M0K6_9LACO|nr:site-specific DNA-methyltransferase [Ligilactobacillus salivarius]PWG50375.1 site-specific DNA-methyltransferase [Ligilactobacillus salivarius]